MTSEVTPIPYATNANRVQEASRQREYYSRVARDRSKARRLGNKLHFIALLGGKCSICGWSGHHAAFDFDHLNKAEKSCEPGAVLEGKDRDEAWAEIGKCRLLCANCHRTESYNKGHLGQKGGQYIKTATWTRNCFICATLFIAKSPRARFCGSLCKDRNQKIMDRVGKEPKGA